MIGTIDAEGDVGCCSEVTLGSYNKPYISYRDEGAGDLKFACQINPLRKDAIHMEPS